MMNEKMIEKLATKGFNRWTKGKYDRMYVNAKDLGLVCEYYKTGNIADATFQGEGISNSEAYRMKAAKTYIDVETGEVVSDNRYLKEAAEEVLEAVKAEIEAEEATAKAAAEAEAVETATDEIKTVETEIVIRERIYKDEKGDFVTAMAATLEEAKAKAEECIREYGKYEGWYDVMIYYPTGKVIKAVKSEGIVYKMAARLETGGAWTEGDGTTVERWENFLNLNKWYEVRK